MSRYLPVKAGESVAVAVCPRCRMKVYYSELKQDPNNKNWYCGDCVDLYDPWRLAARQPENVTLAHPRPDTDLE